MSHPHGQKQPLEPCSGALEWGRRSEIVVRRECPLCGYREEWNNRKREWVPYPANPNPGQEMRQFLQPGS